MIIGSAAFTCMYQPPIMAAGLLVGWGALCKESYYEKNRANSSANQEICPAFLYIKITCPEILAILKYLCS